MHGDRLEVTVRDEGCGVDMKDRHLYRGIGLRSMEARALSLGGEFKVFPVREGDDASGLGSSPGWIRIL